MPSIRIVPCLDVKDGRVVKGVNFRNLRDSGDPFDFSKLYYEQGADEITLLDISASLEGRSATLRLVEKCAGSIFVPLTVGGGVRSVDQVRQLLSAGADKVSVGTAGISQPDLINDIAQEFGSQVLVASLDIKRMDTVSGFGITRLGGTEDTSIDALEWASELSARGAGELLINAMDADGTREGFDLELLSAIRTRTSLPIIASGGAGSVEDFIRAARVGADALLAASVFHDQTLTIEQTKQALSIAGFEVRESA